MLVAYRLAGLSALGARRSLDSIRARLSGPCRAQDIHHAIDDLAHAHGALVAPARGQRNEPSRPSIASASLALAIIAPARFKCNQFS
jgi:hypothetical protein